MTVTYLHSGAGGSYFPEAVHGGEEDGARLEGVGGVLPRHQFGHDRLGKHLVDEFLSPAGLFLHLHRVTFQVCGVNLQGSRNGIYHPATRILTNLDGLVSVGRDQKYHW